jgi:hypothetical protein
MMLWSIFQGRKVLALKANLKDIVTEIAATMAFATE